jgi:tetratricopeptide (TPR) repeat protein
MIWLLAGLALAQDELAGAGLDPVAQQFYLSALEAERGGDWDRAVSAYELVLRSDPAYTQARLGMARAQLQLGRPVKAEALLRQLPMDADAVQLLAELQLEGRPEESVQLYRRLQTLRLGEAEPHRFEAEAALAAGDLNGSVEALERYLDLDGAEEAPEPTGELYVALAEALKEADRREEARAWLDRFLESWPEGELAEEVRARLERMDVEDAAEHLAVGGAEALGPEQREELEGIRRDLASGRKERARERLEVLVEQAPRSPEVWSTSGDLHQSSGRVAEAEQAYLTAVALEPDEASWRVRLGLLLARRYGGRRHREAAQELQRAGTLRPNWSELDYLLGTVLQESGEFDGALQAYADYLARSPEGEFAEDARQLLQDLERERPEPPALESLLARPPEGIPEPAWLHFKLAKVYLEDQQDDAAALGEVQAALIEAPDYVDAVNLLAHLQLRSGDLDGAMDSYERSLRIRPDQPLTVLAIGYSLQDSGQLEPAKERFREAADLGAEEAWYALAALEVEAGDWLVARTLLGEYFARASGGRKHQAAQSLRAELERRYRMSLAAAGGALALAVVVPGILVWRRRSGATLRQLLERAPESYHDVATVLSAMRHEVLKHNTTQLEAAADALDRGDDAPVVEAMDRLLGRGQEGVIAAWDHYLGELHAIGLRHGVRLNLRRRDPVLAPMCAAFSDLRKVGEGIRPGSVRSRDFAASELRRLAVVLNREGYVELSALIREVCVLELDRAFLERCWAQVRQEPAFAGAELPSLELQAPQRPLSVRIFRRELQDIVVNILRNAAQAVVEERAEGQRRLLVQLELEEDFVTGLESVLLRFADNAESTLTAEMIRGRYIARGFGLVVDLVGRHEGSISVEQLPGWTKAIVVRLPRAERPEGA